MDVKKEIELAIKRENPDWDGKSFDYGIAIYQNVLECYEAIYPLIEKAGHSGMSYSFFLSKFMRVLEDKPLTPITEEDFNEDFPEESGLSERIGPNGNKVKQCVRYPSLFRNIDINGKVTYNDVDRIIIIDQYGLTWHSNWTEKLCEDLIPSITLPYMPSNNTIKIYVWQFSYNKIKQPKFYIERGSYNAEYIDRIVFPDGEIIKVDRLYLEDEDNPVNYTSEMIEEIKQVVEEGKRLREEDKLKEMSECEKLD